MPIIYGAVLAYLMLPIYNKSRAWVFQSLERHVKQCRHADGIAKAAATLVSLLVLLAIVSGLFYWL